MSSGPAVTQWRKIDIAPLYEVSNTGRVRSLDRTVVDKNGVAKRLKGREFKLQGKSHYLGVQFGKEGPRDLVHRLVARHFIPNPLGKPVVNHKDTDRFNNHEDNLEWTTHTENQQHWAGVYHNASSRLRSGSERLGEHGRYYLVHRDVRDGNPRGEVLWSGSDLRGFELP